MIPYAKPFITAISWMSLNSEWRNGLWNGCCRCKASSMNKEWIWEINHLPSDRIRDMRGLDMRTDQTRGEGISLVGIDKNIACWTGHRFMLGERMNAVLKTFNKQYYGNYGKSAPEIIIVSFSCSIKIQTLSHLCL